MTDYTKAMRAAASARLAAEALEAAARMLDTFGGAEDLLDARERCDVAAARLHEAVSGLLDLEDAIEAARRPRPVGSWAAGESELSPDEWWHDREDDGS